MADSSNPPPSSQEATACQKGDGEPLTDAQRDFAKLLGRLLAQRWSDEQRGKQEDPSETRNSETMRCQNRGYEGGLTPGKAETVQPDS